MLVDKERIWIMTFTKFLTEISGLLLETLLTVNYMANNTSGSIYKIKEDSLNVDAQYISQFIRCPNPVKPKLTIDFGIKINQESKLYVFNIHG